MSFIPSHKNELSASVEAFFPGTNKLAGLIEGIAKGFSTFGDTLAKAFTEVKTDMRANSIANVNSYKFEYSAVMPSALRAKGYIGVVEVGVQIPPGFNGNMADYIIEMNNVMNLFELFNEKYYNEFDKYISTLLNDLNKTNSHQSVLDSELVNSINKEKTIVADYFTGSKAAIHQEFGKIYRNLNEYYDSLGNLNKLLNRVNAYNPTKVTKQIDSLSEKSDRLILKLRKTNTDVSRAVAKDMANLIYTMASVFEFYGAFVQFVNELYVSAINVYGAVTTYR